MPNFSDQQDFSVCHCSLCYLNWLVDHSKEIGCHGSINGQVCLGFYPPLKPEVQAQSRKALSSFLQIVESE